MRNVNHNYNPYSLKALLFERNLEERFDVPPNIKTTLTQWTDAFLSIAVPAICDIIQQMPEGKKRIRPEQLQQLIQDADNNNHSPQQYGMAFETPQKFNSLVHYSIDNIGALHTVLPNTTYNCHIFFVISPFDTIDHSHFNVKEKYIIIPLGIEDLRKVNANYKRLRNLCLIVLSHEVLHFLQVSHNKQTKHINQKDQDTLGIYGLSKYPIGISKKKYQDPDFAVNGIYKSKSKYKNPNLKKLTQLFGPSLSHTEVPMEFYPNVETLYNSIRFALTQPYDEFKGLSVWRKFKKIISYPHRYMEPLVANELTDAKYRNIKLYNGYIKELYKKLRKTFAEVD